MKRITILGVLLLILLGTNLCWAKTQEEARIILAQMKLEFNEHVFFDKIKEKDNFAVSLFLDAGINYNSVTSDDNTPLKIAVFYNNIEAVKLLLSKPDIDISREDKSGKSAIDIAYIMGNKEIVDILQEKGQQVKVIYKELLSEKQIQEAIYVGKEVANKQDIIYAQMDTDKTHSGFLGADIQTIGRAYWLTPFCTVANENLVVTKKYEAIDQSKIKRLSNTYQARIVFTLTNTNTNWDDLKIIAIQDNKIILPYFVQFISTQIKQQPILFGGVFNWYRTGFIANFYAPDIDITKPIEIKAILKASKELTFRFKNNYEKYNYYNAGTDEFKW